MYARKFRKKVYDEKGVFSDVNCFKPVFDTVYEAYTQRRAMAEKATVMGQDSDRLAVLRAQVRQEIQALPGFCKSCTPPKKKSAGIERRNASR